MILHFMYHEIIYILLPVLALAALYRLFLHKKTHYRYPLVKLFSRNNLTSKSHHKKIIFFTRLCALLALIFLIARPVWVDQNSNVNVEGIDMVLTIDVSESMNIFDDLKDRRPRIDVAKQEAIRFIEKRTNDPIGIVIFGREVISRCPLTLDKNILKELVGAIEIGMIDDRGTWLGTGLATSVNLLRASKAKSKVIVLLTDGDPTPQEKVDPETAISLAKQFGIRVYTVGVGNVKGGYINQPFFGVQKVQQSLDEQLLKNIAEKTGGLFIRANNPKEIRLAYDTIDKLEKTKYQTTLFHRYYEAFLTYIWIVLVLLAVELTLRLFVWRGI